MSDNRSLLQREMQRVQLRPFTVDSVYRRRDRKRRNERLAAGAVGIAVFAALLLAAVIIRTNRTAPAHPGPSPSIESTLPSILKPGEGLWTMWISDLDVGQGPGVERVLPTGRSNRNVFDCTGGGCPWVIDHGQAFLSGDGKWAAEATVTSDTSETVHSTDEIWVANGVGQVIRVTHACADGPCHGQTWAWSPVGPTLAIWEGTDPQQLYLFDPVTGKRTLLTQPEGNGVEGLTWSPDGSLVTYAVEGSTPASAKIYTIPVSGGSPMFVADGLDPIWSPDGNKLAYVVPDRGLFVVNADGSGATLIGEDGAEAAWSPDGSRIAYRVEQGSELRSFHEEIWVVSSDGSERVKVLDGTWGTIERRSLMWSPDGTRIAFQGTRKNTVAPGQTYVERLYVVNADGSGTLEPMDRSERREFASWRS
jgi:dipeptidyl aminopeptidase/acylaminoacyl peptidase